MKTFKEESRVSYLYGSQAVKILLQLVTGSVWRR